MNLVKLFIYVRNVETKSGNKFKKYSTKALFRTKDENGKVTSDLMEKFIEVKFTENAFDGTSLKLSDIKRGVLEIDGSYVGCPDVYEITEKDGKKVYPSCFIRGGIQSFTPVEKLHKFNFVLEEDTNEPEIE